MGTTWHHASTSTVKPNIYGKKLMLCIWDQLGVVYYELLKSNETITGALYRTQLMRLSRALKKKRAHYYSRYNKIILCKIMLDHMLRRRSKPTRYISLNPLFFSQKNTFFFPRKQKQIYSKYLPSLTIHLSSNLCIPCQKNSSSFRKRVRSTLYH